MLEIEILKIKIWSAPEDPQGLDEQGEKHSGPRVNFNKPPFIF